MCPVAMLVMRLQAMMNISYNKTNKIKFMILIYEKTYDFFKF